ncbi:phage major capsid protein [Sphingomonas sp. BK235]|uniref:phage major capsid protein n=1 Tax=Sphingomonas sp. BK235 TaxID=2512131 RepID=UPI001043E7AD|nr:phage major capsid protein [Sphingomonas sp. BK235]TCP33603.1 HK97 family phage major capsid protein [Sphingomonas sp. BK235]
MTDTVDARPLLEGARPERDAGFARYIRSGATLETKAFTGTTGEGGGVAIPTQLDDRIDAQLVGLSPIRAIANVVQVGSAGYRKLITSGGTPSGWAGETDPRPVTATPTFHELVPPGGELYANPSASQAMLDDALFDAEAWLAAEIATEFAKAEGAAFVDGSGEGRPRGFLRAPLGAAPDGRRAFGTLQYLPSGAAGDFAGDPAERLIDLVQALRAPYRQGACFVMNAATAARVRKVKTRDGQFLWQPGLAAAQPATLLGYPVVEAEDMPDVAPDSPALAFGNFRLGYLIADRGETAVLRDPYSNKPFVTFYATRRVAGCVADSDAIKLLKFAEK